MAAIPKDIPTVLDVKRGDIGETQGYYAKACFDVLNADAVTLNPYMGRDTLEPFLKYSGKGIYLLGVTSNPGAKDIELQKAGDRHIYELVADMTTGQSQAGLVVGLTNAAPDVLTRIPDVPLLIPARHVLVLMRQLGASDSCSGDNPYRGTITELRFAATG
jgi:orotidine 5'-phosphate decarboxylase subfamily 2